MRYLFYGFIGFVVLALAAWFSHRKHRHLACLAIGQLRDESEIEGLATEFKTNVKDHFKMKLSDPIGDDELMIIDHKIRSGELLSLLQKKELKWKFALLTGAYLGEEIKRHGGFQWMKSETGEYYLRKAVGEATLEMYPFDKIIKHYQYGSNGDLFAYVKMAIAVERGLGELPGNVNSQ